MFFSPNPNQACVGTSAKCSSNLIPIREILIPICAAWDYWSIILYFHSPLFASGGPLLSIRPPLLLSPVALNTLVALWLSLAQTLILQARACADLLPSGPRLRGPLLFRSVLAWIFAPQVRASADLCHPVLACVDLMLLVHNIVARIPWSTVDRKSPR